jgi:GDP-L-fucose synthase
MTADETKTSTETTTPSVVMVTGGSGLVGSAIRDYVTANPKEGETFIFLSSKDGDLRDRKATEAIFEKFKPTHVIHVAAKVGGLFANMAQKVSSFLYVFECV